MKMKFQTSVKPASDLENEHCSWISLHVKERQRHEVVQLIISVLNPVHHG